MLHSIVISGIIQSNEYVRYNDKNYNDVTEHHVIDHSGEIEENLNEALSKLPENAQIVQILSDTYQVAFHNNGGNNTNGITYTILWRD